MAMGDAWKPKDSSNDRKVYHTNPDCWMLKRAVNKRPIDPDTPPYSTDDDWTECKYCSGEIEKKSAGNELSNKLLFMDPEEAGLSPRGERGGL